VSSTRGGRKSKSEGERLTRWFLVLIGLSTLLQGVDRQLLGVLMDPIKHDLKLSDTAMGALAGTTFALFYLLGSFPLARLADTGSRRSLLAMCLGFWSLMTALCGLAVSSWQLAVARAGVALGEAGNIPASMSLIAEGRPKHERGRGPLLCWPAKVLVLHWDWSWEACLQHRWGGAGRSCCSACPASWSRC
jgi:MFS family permease